MPRIASTLSGAASQFLQKGNKDMTDIVHWRSKRHQSYVTELTVQIGGPRGAILIFRDRLAWALLCLIEAGEVGVAPLDRPAPRWSQYVLMLRKAGIVIETLLEKCGGPYAGRRGRYLLRSSIKIVDRREMA
jgi:hypothetical protein